MILFAERQKVEAVDREERAQGVRFREPIEIDQKREHFVVETVLDGTHALVHDITPIE